MATELAKAYVQIIPSAKGIKGNLKNIMNNEANGAGNSAGMSLASKLKGAIAAAGIGTALKAAISEGASVEQSTGGIETLFKDSADKVLKSAQNAYKTAGMSANQYMETVTGFSASLLQGLSGDTNKAADVADMALTDMSDNANKMGTSMELIQNAYQGFAKQNYTMLDNLKLGYGGTKEEMQRLLADAQEISGVKYDIKNLSDVYSAIHVIQEEMGITGTTAKEASETVSGSFAAMKGAMQTFLGNIATGQDATTAFEALLTTSKTFLFDNMIPMIGNVITGVGNTIIQTDWTGIAKNMITNFCESMGGEAQAVLENDGSIIDAIIAGVQENFPKIVSKGSDIVLKIITGIGKKLPDVLSSGVEIVLKVLKAIISNAPKLLEGGITLIGKLANGILSAVPGLIDKMPGIITKIKKAFTEIKWSEVGKNIIDGIIKGLKNTISSLLETAEEIARSVLNAVKGVLDINSPSGAFEDEVGKQGIDGWALGFRKNADVLYKVLKDISNKTIGIVNANVIGNRYADSMTYGDVRKYRDDVMYWKRLGDYILEGIKDSGDKQAKAIENGLASMKMVANKREVGRFMSDMGFSRG